MLSQIWYNPDDVILAWDAFISGAQGEPLLSNASNFRHDLVDLTRQSLQEIFNLFYKKLTIAYSEKNISTVG